MLKLVLYIPQVLSHNCKVVTSLLAFVRMHYLIVQFNGGSETLGNFYDCILSA